MELKINIPYKNYSIYVVFPRTFNETISSWVFLCTDQFIRIMLTTHLSGSPNNCIAGPVVKNSAVRSTNVSFIQLFNHSLNLQTVMISITLSHFFPSYLVFFQFVYCVLFHLPFIYIVFWHNAFGRIVTHLQWSQIFCCTICKATYTLQWIVSLISCLQVSTKTEERFKKMSACL